MSEAVLNLHPVAGGIGAEVRDLRLSGELAPATFAALRHYAVKDYGDRHCVARHVVGQLREAATAARAADLAVAS
jgi:hypothetical protein